MEVSRADNQTLRRIVRDLAAITLLPSIWSGYTPQAIAEGLSDVLLTVLNLDLVYVCLKEEAGEIEVARTRTQLCPPAEVTNIGRALDNWQEMNGATSVRSVSSPLGEGKLRIATLTIGYEGPQNRVIIGTRAETLGETDLLLFKAASNQAAIALQQAHLLARERRSLREAEKAIEERDAFLAVAAHELKTPITSLRGFVDLLLRQLDKHGSVDANKLQRALKAVNEQSIKLGNLVGQMLDLSRIEAGRLTLEPKLTDIALLVQNVAGDTQKRADHHIIRVSAPSTIPSFVDSLRLEQVIINLLENAIKFSPDGGPIDISVELSDTSTAVISVRDWGLGIPVERRENIFNRFYQAHADGYRGGMGLGLYISRQIVELHGGSIHAEFPDNGGTCFIINLPTRTENIAPIA